jgi:hypothetical protein
MKKFNVMNSILPSLVEKKKKSGKIPMLLLATLFTIHKVTTHTLSYTVVSNHSVQPSLNFFPKKGSKTLFIQYFIKVQYYHTIWM